MMSLSELLVIILVAFLVMKPEDLPKIIRKIKEFKDFFTKTKKEMISYIDPDSKDKDIASEEPTPEEIEQINFYLEKIARLGGEYEGQYSLSKIRNHYHKLIRNSYLDKSNY